MLTEVVIKRIHSAPNSWVRVEQVGKIRGGLELSLGVDDGTRGKKLACWCVSCSGLHETKITDFDGGGLRLYTSDHPAAKQCVARRVELRWDRNCNQAAVLATLYQAHIDVVEDWIPFERYLLPNIPYTRGFQQRSAKEFGCRGPDFLVQAYGKALRLIGENVRVIPLRDSRRKAGQPGVLHFGTSYVVAEAFSAKRLD